jgi:hypothetical protein
MNMLLHCLNGQLRCNASGAFPSLFVALYALCPLPGHFASQALQTHECYAGSHDQDSPAHVVRLLALARRLEN